MFTRGGSTWSQQGAKLSAKAGEEVGEGYFGLRVALDSDGNTALIGAPSDSENKGAAWVFTRSVSTWSQNGGKLTGAGATGKEFYFGYALALSAEGQVALIGGSGDNSYKGAAWVFEPKFSGGAEASGLGLFGHSVALSSDGNTALVGAPYDNSGKARPGCSPALARPGASRVPS